MIDELPIYASLDFSIHQCDCCGRKGLKRAVCISSVDFNPICLGVICTGKWFNINLSGNPYKAVIKLQKKLNIMQNNDILNIIEEVKKTAKEWKMHW